MNIRVILTQFLVGAIAILLLVQIFTSHTTFEYIWRASLFIAFLVFGYLLIRSVLNEIKRREEMEKLSAELTKAYDDLERLDKAKSEFISIASHQLRTPLTAIKGYVSMMIDGSYGEISHTLKGKLLNVFQSSERLIHLVNDLLSVSRIESGKIEINPEPTQIEDVIASTVDVLKIQAKNKKIKLLWEKPKKPLPKVFVDPDRIREVILNLVDNAIKYTQKGAVTVRNKVREDSVLVLVEDTGEGMTKEEIAKVFKSFSRGSAGNQFYTEGMGLGLYIAKEFVDMQKGKIWVESEGKGKGSKFFIELPISK